MQPVLSPGTHLLRRDDRALQLGLDPRHAWVLDEPVDLTRLDPAPPDGLLLSDDRPLRAVLPPAGTSPGGRRGWSRHGVAALARRTHAGLEEALAGREAHHLVVETFGGPLADDFGALLTDTLVRCDLRLASRRHGPLPRASRSPQRVAVLVGVGEPDRDGLDRLLRDHTPHLVVRLTEGRAVVGPFVVPGRTACQRCLDAHHTDADPCWPLLVEQYARATRHDRADGVPEPGDAALATVAAGWAARDVATYVEGGTPTSFSATVTLTPTLEALESRRWPRHPRCGCSWA